MPEKLDEEKIEDVLDAYEREGSYAGAAEKTGVSKKTVKKYVERRLESDDDDSAEEQSGSSQSSVIEMDAGNDRLVDLTDQELMDLSEAEFIRTFFQEFSDMGVRDSFVEMIANQAQVRRQIPDEDQMSQRLQSHNSGIGNANDANAISELYWALAQRYLNARGLASGGNGPGGPVQTGPQGGSFGGGDWVSAPDGGRAGRQQGGQQAGGDGEWVDTNPGPGGQQPGQHRQQPNQQGGAGMEQMFQQVMAQQQRMMQTMMEQNQKTEKDRLEEEIAELKQEINSNDDGGESMTDSMKEVMELREMLDQFEGNDNDDRMEQVVGTLQQQLSALQQEIRDGNSSVDMAEMASGGDSQMGMLMALAQSGNVDPNEMVTLAQQLGEVETNPQVAEKKYEKQIEEMKVEAEQEKWESILNGVEELATTFGGALTGELPDETSEGDGAPEAEPEVTAKRTEAAEEPEEQPMSPAQRLVAGGGEGEQEAEPEPGPVEQEGITPDTTDPEAVEVEVVDDGDAVLVDEEAVPDDVEPAEPAVEPEPESEVVEEPVEEPDPEPEVYVCEFCGREFERERQRRGHLANCPERDA